MYEIFVKLLKERGLSAYQVARATGIPQATLSDWKRGISTPKQDKIRKLAEFFNVPFEYLNEGIQKPNAIDENKNLLVIDDEAVEVLEAIKTNPEMKMLFSVSKKASKKELLQAIKIIEALKGSETDE